MRSIRNASRIDIATVRGRGLLLGVELVKDRNTLEPFPKDAGLTTKVVVAGLGEGTFFYPGGCDPARDVITLGPPFIITDDEIERIATSLERAITTAVSWVAARAA